MNEPTNITMRWLRADANRHSTFQFLALDCYRAVKQEMGSKLNEGVWNPVAATVRDHVEGMMTPDPDDLTGALFRWAFEKIDWVSIAQILVREGSK